jgi:AbrB family looped-hinge helix DNA binding protein
MIIIVLVWLLISESRVGSKGELFTTKEIREKLGLKPNTKVVLRVEDGRLVVEPIPSLEQLLAEPPQVEITAEEDEAERRKLSRETEA